MAHILSSFKVPDYEQWKARFDSDPVGRRETGTGHQVFQDVDDPNHVFVGLEFPSADEAKAFAERLQASGILDDLTAETTPAVVEVVDRVTY